MMIRRPATLAILAVLWSASVAACNDSSKSSSSGAQPPSGSDAAPASAAASTSVGDAGSANAASELSLADGSSELTVAWKVEQRAYPTVAASVTVGDKVIALGELNATSDSPEEDGKVAACGMRGATAKSSELCCGGTPLVNCYGAKLAGGELVISRTDGVDGEPAQEKITVVTRRPTRATSLRSSGPASPLLYGNCHRGFVQRTPEGACMRQCLKGTECKASEKCEMIKVQGGDGPHKVHACVPPGK